MTAPDWQELVDRQPHPAVTRLADGSGRQLLIKRVTPVELAAHRLAASVASAAVPAIVADWPIAGSRDRLILMPDHGRSCSAVDGGPRAILGAALERLAAVHAAFAGSPEPAAAGIPAAGPGATGKPGILPERNAQWRLGLTRAQLAGWARLEVNLPVHRRLLADEREWTLVHGDLHAGNVVAEESGNVRILDWQTAARQVAAWDLATFDEQLVRRYLAARAAIGRSPDEPSFRRQLRAATAIRLHTAVVEILADDGPELDRGVRRSVVRRCVERAV